MSNVFQLLHKLGHKVTDQTFTSTKWTQSLESWMWELTKNTQNPISVSTNSDTVIFGQFMGCSMDDEHM